MNRKRINLLIFTVCLAAIFFAAPVMAAEGGDTQASIDALKDEMQNNINIVWTCVAAFLVFFMQAGFAMVEAGFTRAKNAVNILMKNIMDFSIGTLAFFVIGFGLMFGINESGFLGTSDFGLRSVLGNPEDWNWTFLIFQTVFAGTAATIVSGAMAGRTKFKAYIVYSVFICGLIYPISGSWAWNSLFGASLGSGEDSLGWLEKLGFCDFAGSTVVHSVGGWLALAGAIVLGPRLGKYGPDGKAKAIPGHNITLAALGVFILWFGWFGFNPGSTTTGNGEI
jgi:Amt family ammonium transporter